jgi:hypothetical protein
VNMYTIHGQCAYVYIPTGVKHIYIVLGSIIEDFFLGYVLLSILHFRRHYVKVKERQLCDTKKCNSFPPHNFN